MRETSHAENPRMRRATSYPVDLSDLNVTDGSVVRMRATAVNRAGLRASVASPPIVIDRTPPLGARLCVRPTLFRKRTGGAPQLRSK